MAYYLQNGDEVTADQINTAFSAGKAVLIHNHRESGIATGLMLDGKHLDTRGECYSVWDEVWTHVPDTVKDALSAAYAY